MKTIHLVIVSWPGQHQRAVDIAESLIGTCNRISIIYSGHDERIIQGSGYERIYRQEPSFWGDKFETAINVCDSDILIMVHADCLCNDWIKFVSKCQVAMRDPSISVYSPMILGSPWVLNRTRINHLHENLFEVAQIDALVFALSKPVISRMRNIDYSKNLFGWGIDWFFVSYSYAAGYKVVMDTSIRVMHKSGSGYDKNQAAQEMIDFLKQMLPAEKDKYDYLANHVAKKVPHADDVAL